MSETENENQATPAVAPAATEPFEQPPADTVVEPEAQVPEQGEEPEDEAAKRPSRSQRYQRKIALLAAENEDLRRANALARSQASPNQERPPQEADFHGDYLAYERALNAFHVRHAAREAVRQEVTRERIERLHGQAAEVHRDQVMAHHDRVEELKERVPDFQDAMRVAATIDMRDEVLDEILASEQSALIQYYLAKNPDKARALDGLSGRELARAVGRLEGAVRLPGRRATGATPPVQPLTGAAGPSFDPSRAEMAAYAADYKRRQQARGRG